MRLSFAGSITLIGLALFLAGCSEQGSASQAADSPLKVQISQMFLTVKNDTALPLKDVTISIYPPTRITAYSKFLDRIETGESRDIMLGEFVGRDGTPFNLRVVKPKTVELKGTDINGKAYNLSIPWK